MNYVAVFKDGSSLSSPDLPSIVNTPSAVCFAEQECLFSWYCALFYSYEFVDKTGSKCPYEYRGYKLHRVSALTPKGSPSLLVELETPNAKFKKMTIPCGEWKGEIESALTLIDNLVENEDAYVQLLSLRREHKHMETVLSHERSIVATYKNAVTAVTTRTSVDEVPLDYCCDAENLLRATITANVKSIGCGSFTSCHRLREVYCYALVPPKVYNDAFKGISKGAILYVPEESLQLYKDNEEWSSRFAIIDIL